MDSEHLQTISFGIILVIVAGLSILIFLPSLYAGVSALIFSIVSKPLYGGIRKFVKNESFASFFTVLAITVIVVAILVFVGTRLFQETRDLYDRLANGLDSDFLNQVLTFVGGERGGSELNVIENLGTYLRQIAGWLLEHLSPIFSGLINFFGTFFLSLLALYYLLRDGEKFEKTLKSLSPLSGRDNDKILEQLKTAAHSVINGSLMVAVVQGVFAGLGFLIFGVPNATLLGLVTILASLLPVVGTAIIVMPAVGYLFLSGAVLQGVGLFLWGVFIVGVIDNVLRPKLIERGTKIHPLLILLSVLGGISTFGFMGFLIGPLVLSFLFALLSIYPTIVAKRSG